MDQEEYRNNSFLVQISRELGAIDSRLKAIEHDLKKSSERVEKTLENYSNRIRMVEDAQLVTKTSAGVISALVAVLTSGLMLLFRFLKDS